MRLFSSNSRLKPLGCSAVRSIANLILNIIEQNMHNNLCMCYYCGSRLLATNLSQWRNQPGFRLSKRASKCVMGFLVRASKPFECFKGGFLRSGKPLHVSRVCSVATDWTHEKYRKLHKWSPMKNTEDYIKWLNGNSKEFKEKMQNCRQKTKNCYFGILYLTN